MTEYILYVLTPQMLHGLVWGMTIVLIALGLTVVFGLMGVVNFAHGEFYMLGAYFGFTTLLLIPNFWVAMLVAIVGVSLLSWGLERFMFRPLYGRDPIFYLLLTFGLSMVLREAARAIWGGFTLRVMPPMIGSLDILGVTYPAYRLLVLFLTIIVVVVVLILLNRTNMGAVIKAAALDSTMLSALGFNVPLVFTITFVIGAALAAMGGVIMSPIYFVYPHMGLDSIILAFIVVIVGGLGSVRGAIAAGILIGEFQSISSLWISPTVADMLVFVMLIIILMVRPSGIFGKA